jgi:hypothetical protein
MKIGSRLLYVLFTALLACGSPDASVSGFSGDLSDEYGRIPDLTPGHLCDENNPDFDGLRYAEQIAHCKRAVSRSTKVAVAAEYGVAESDLHKYEIDHYLSLSIGGSNEPANLWPLKKIVAREKSGFESMMFEKVKAGEWTQAEAIERLRAWRPSGQRQGQGN